jgi:serine O-acetyltransferase
MFNRLREDLSSIMERDPAARSAWEVVTCYPGVHAIVMHRWAKWCWLRDLKWLARFISQLARFFTGIEIHPGASIGRRVFIDHGLGVVIGETAEVGDDCTIYQGVTLGGTSLNKGAKRHPSLERSVIVGAGAKVLGGFTVGAGAKIGSNTVLTKAIPPGATAVGNPARIILKERVDPHHAATARMFAAYGVTLTADDPLSKALHGLINNAAAQELQIGRILASLKCAGIGCEGSDKGDKFDSAEMSKLVE